MALTSKAEKTKAKLLASAKELISKRGFENVSVEDITKNSGVAKGTFYHHFKCKEDVVAELSFISAKKIIDTAVNSDEGVIDKCIYHAKHMFQEADWTGIRLIRQWLRDTMEAESETEAKENLRGMYEGILTVLSSAVGEKTGDLKSDAPVESLAKIYMAHFMGVLTLWCMMNGSFSINEEQGFQYTKLSIETLLKPYVVE